MTEAENLAQKKDDSNSKMDSLIKWRREKAWEYRAMGCGIDEIVDILKVKPEVRVSHATICRDLRIKEKQVKEGFKTYIEKDLPLQHHLAVTGLEKVIKEGWRMYAKTEDPKILAIIADAYMKKLGALGDPAQIQSAIRLVASLRKRIEEPDDRRGGSRADEDAVKEGLVTT